MRKQIVGLALLLSFNSYAVGDDPFPGDYNCKGQEIESNKPYTCKMSIHKTGDTYASTAICDDGNSYQGTGILDNQSGSLSTVFINPKDKAETGVSVSSIKNDKMESAWTYLNKTVIGHTICEKNPVKSGG